MAVSNDELIKAFNELFLSSAKRTMLPARLGVATGPTTYKMEHPERPGYYYISLGVLGDKGEGIAKDKVGVDPTAEFQAIGVRREGHDLVIREAEHLAGGSNGAVVLDDLSDVHTVGKADGDLLMWDELEDQWVAYTPTGGGLEIHALSESGGIHTGDLDDAQAPQFLKHDGSRDLTGDLAVGVGVTIDGVDLDVHAADPNAHHDLVTAGNVGLSVTDQVVSLNLASLSDPGLEIVGGLRIKTPANPGLVVDEDGLYIPSSFAGDGLVLTSGVLHIREGFGLEIDGSDFVRIDQDATFTWTAAHTHGGLVTFNTTPNFNSNINFTGSARSLTSAATFTLNPTGDLYINPTAEVRFPDAQEIRSDTYSDLPTGIPGLRFWQPVGNFWQLNINAIKADQLFVRVFTVDEVRLSRGEEYWSKSFGIVQEAFALPAINVGVSVWFEDAPDLGALPLFAEDDWIMIRHIDMSVGLVAIAAWFTVANPSLTTEGWIQRDDTNDRQQWRLVRRQGGTTAFVVRKGVTALCAGQEGQGWIHLSALTAADGSGGPFIQMGTMTDDALPVPVHTNRIRIGNLNGSAGFTSETYGMAAGNDIGLDPDSGNFSGFTVDSTNGLRLYNTDINLLDGAILGVRLNIDAGLALMQDTGQNDNEFTGIHWYSDVATKSGPHSNLSSYSTVGGTTFFMSVVDDDLPATIALLANGNAQDSVLSLSSNNGFALSSNNLIHMSSLGDFTVQVGAIEYIVVDESAEFLHLSPENHSVQIGVATSATKARVSINGPVLSSPLSAVSSAHGLSLYSEYGTGTEGAYTGSLVFTRDLGDRAYSGLMGIQTGALRPQLGVAIMVKGSATTVDSDMVEGARFTHTSRLGLNIKDPVSRLHIYDDSSSTGASVGINIQQDGSGDAQIRWFNDSQSYVAGIDGTDGKWKLSIGSVLGTNNSIVVDPATGNVVVTGLTVSGGGGGVHNPASGGDGISVVDDGTNQVVAVNSSVVRTSRTITAGNGLTGTDTLANDISLNVVALSTGGLVANANDIAVKLPANSGLDTDSTGLFVDDSIAGNGLGILDKVLFVEVSSTGGIQIISDHLQINLPANSGLTTDGSGLHFATTFPGAGLTLTTGVLAVVATSGGGITVNPNDIEVDNTVVRTTRTITAGAGLTGTSTLASDVTLDITAAADSGIQVNTDSIQVKLTTANAIGLIADSNGLRVLRRGASGLTSGISITSADGLFLANSMAGDGVEWGTSGDRVLRVKLATDSALISDSSGLRVNTGIAGDGLVMVTGVLAVGEGPGINATGNTVEIALASPSGLNTTSGLAVDSSLAGAGLLLTAAVMNVVALSTGGLQANANDLQVKLPAFSGLTTDSTGLYVRDDIAGAGMTMSASKILNVVPANTSLTVGADSMNVNLDHDWVWTGDHTWSSPSVPTFNVIPQINNNLNFVGSSRAITAAGDLTLDPTGLLLLPTAQTFRTSTFTDSVTGILGFSQFDTGGNVRQLTVGKIKADELFVRFFTADEVRVNRGEEFWARSYGIVQTDFVIPEDEANVDVWFEEAPLLDVAKLFLPDNWIQFRTIDWTSGAALTVLTVWFQVVDAGANDYVSRENATTTIPSRQQWRLKRKSGGVTSAVIKAGNVAVDFGKPFSVTTPSPGQGIVHLSALDQDDGPFVQISTFESVSSDVPQFANRVRMGNLRNTVDFGASAYGFAAGNNLGETPETGFSGFTVEEAGGLRLFNSDIEMYEDADKIVTLTDTTGLRFFLADDYFANRAVSWLLDIDDVVSPGEKPTGMVLNAKWDDSTDFVTAYLDVISPATTGDSFLSIRAQRTGGTSAAILQMSADTASSFEFNVSAQAYAKQAFHFVETSTHDSTAGILVENQSSGDAKVAFKIPTASGSEASIGIDNSDGNKFKISRSSSLGTSDRITIGDGVGATDLVTILADLTISSGMILTAPIIAGTALTGLVNLSLSGTLHVLNATHFGNSAAAPHLVAISKDGTNADLSINSYGTGFVPQLFLYAPRGTLATPTANQASDVLGNITFQGFDTARSDGAKIYAVASANWGTAGSGTDSPTELRFATVADASGTLVDNLIVGSDGIVKVKNIIRPTTAVHLAFQDNAGNFGAAILNGGGFTRFANGNKPDLIFESLDISEECIQVQMTRPAANTVVFGFWATVSMVGRVGTVAHAGRCDFWVQGRNSATIQTGVGSNTNITVTVVTQTSTDLTLKFAITGVGSGPWNEFTGTVISQSPLDPDWTFTNSMVAG